MTKEIPLRCGGVAIVDDEMYDELMKFDWSCTASGHAARYEPGKIIYMHRVILRASSGMVVDHINGIPADNRSENLRECTHHQNLMNRRPNRTVKGGSPSSKFRGVQALKSLNPRWRARIVCGGIAYALGTYGSEEEAAKAYDAAARYYYGEFAFTNFPGDLALSAKEPQARSSGKRLDSK